MTDEFRVRAGPRVAGKKVNVFKMHKDDNLSWTEAKMRRENDYQPWQIKLGQGRAGKRYKAIKEGGVGENASYFIFYKTKDSPNTLEVCPVDEWYNVSATQRYKTLTAEEAEQKFEQRHKTLNLFSVMVKKGAGEGGPDGEGGSAGDSKKGFKISEMDEWDQSGDDFGASDDDNDRDGEGGGNSRKKARGRGVKKEKDDPEDAPEEGKEDSDEGDFEQREVDYMSDSSESSVSESGEAPDVNDVRGIAESEALRDLLDTEDEEDAEGSPRKVAKPTAIKSTFDNNHDEQRDNRDDDGSDDSSDSDDYDVDEDKMDTMFMKKSLPSALVKREQLDQHDYGNSIGSTSNLTTSTTSATTSSSSSSVSTSRKSEVAPTISSSATTTTTTTTAATTTPQSSASRRTNPVEPTSPANTYERTIEDLIIKYLRRKPMTLKSILTTIKAKLKKMGMEIEKNIDRDNELVNTIASIIKRLPTERQKIGDTMHVSLRQ